MTLVFNLLFHLLIITWNAYHSVVQMEEFINGDLAGKAPFLLLLRITVVVFFSVNFWRITRIRKDSDPI